MPLTFQKPAAKRTGKGSRKLASFTVLSLVASLLFVGSVPAAAVSGQIDGTVFDDVNENGTNDAESGVAGVRVEAIDAGGNVAASDDTDGSGDYALTGLTDGIIYRVEFSGLPAGYTSGPAGTDSDTSATFAQPDTSGVDYGIRVPSACSHSIPNNALLNTYNTAVSCTVRADPSYPQDTFGLIDVSNAVPNSGRVEQTGSTPMFHLANDWSITRLGNVFGVAVDTERGDIFTVASSNYSSGMYNDAGGPTDAATQYGTIGGGADDLGAAGTIYQLDAVTGIPTVFAQLPQSLTTITHRDCEAGDTRNRDTGVGLGHITYDETNDQLFVTNFEDGRIYRLSMNGTILDAYDPYAADDAVAGMPGDTIPFAVEVADDGSRLWWGTLYGRQVVSIDLTGSGTFPGTSSTVGGLTVFAGATETANITLTQSDTTSNATVAARVQQFVSDLQITPNGTMLVGLRAGCYNTPHSSYNHFGETQQLTPNGSGFYTSTLGAMDISWTGFAGIEDSYGGVAHYVNGSGDTEYVVSSSDIINEAGPHGIAVFEQADAGGAPVSPLGAIDYGTGDDPKGIGGDVDVLNTTCVNSPLEIGNYVWFDADSDGVQDPNEVPLAGVGVTLYAANGTTVIATTTTDASGNYLFDTVDGVDYNTGYEIGFDVSTNTTPLPGGATNANLIETTANSGTATTLGADSNDSDVDSGRIVFSTAGPGDNDHTLDAGYTLPYDLALTKSYTSDDFGNTADGIIEDGSDVTFTITVTNQGFFTASNFTVTDYLPTGFDLNDGSWAAGAGNTATFDYSGALAPGGSTDITITMTANGSAAGPQVNWAEISADDGNDTDSTPDTDQGNDNQPADVGDPTDGVIDNTDGDEDDHDPAGVTVQAYDLALIKTYTSDDFGNTTDGIIEDGSNVTFTIAVANQGTVAASNFTVTDYLPANFDLNDGAWTAGAGNTATYDFVGTLAPGTATDVTITMTANGAADGGHANWAEISADDGNDADSTPDATQGNDNQPADVGDPTDNVTDNTSGDEDDHDPAGVTVSSYDLALIKTYTSDDFTNTTDGIIEDGANVTFTITVTNQGTQTASTFTVTDYLPANFDLNDGAWTAGAGNTATYGYTGTLDPGDTVDIPITMTANGASAGDAVNWAEISADDGSDVDSTTDATQGNDNQPADVGDPTDDVIDNTDGDEDDHDPAGVTVIAYDLALIKTYTSDDFANTTDGIIEDGSNVTFTVTVTNQGTVASSAFTITDYLPANFDLNDGAWTAGAGNTATYDFVGTLAPGNSTDITITMTANGAAPGSHVNWAEISADDGNDPDSTPDTTQGNDNQPADVGDPTDDVIDNTSGDEDDHDPAGVTVASYDLALVKAYTSDDFANTTDGVIENGSDVTFTITVTNQGTQTASTFTVTDYLPTGFDLNDGAWTAGAGNTATYDFVGTLAPGNSIDIPITMTANGVSAGDAVNWAEISADDGNDIDSTPDATQGNDSQPADVGDPTDGVIDNTDGDEDDHDPAGVTVIAYDLALTKTYTSDDFANTTDGIIEDGSNVTFTITVTNQGTVASSAFTVTDYLPANFDLNDGAWTAGAGNTATYDFVGTLAPGTSTDITITMTANGAADGDHVNWAEISADDGNDPDSTPDTTQGNDNQPADVGDPTDDVIDNTDGDEDDHDPAGITVTSYDLALTKAYTADDFTNTTDGIIENGSNVTFTITVTNQGTQTASNFTVTDYLPANFDLNDGTWTAGAGNTATYDFVGTLTPGNSTDITVTMTANGASAGASVNWAEISSDDGNDVDSTTDATQGNDNQPADVGDPTDDVIDNTDGDEDDHDPAGVTVTSYDLALTKSYTSDDFGNTTDGIIDDGSDVTFTITVTNQGTVASSAFTVTDYLPANFDLNDGAWAAGAGNTATFDFVGTLAPSTSTDITITMTANGAADGDFVNWAEISADDGNDPDSTPDATQGNDNQPADVGDPTDDVIDNTDGDEDDHDPAGITVTSYDLALTKSYTADDFGNTTDGVIDDGSDVTFTITVTNQGTQTASNFTVTDYLPANFDLNDGAWAAGAGNTATFDFVGTLAPGNSTDITITMTANGAADGDFVNWAEISADDGADDDSTPDATQGNDNQPADVGDPTDDVIDNTDGDEDDHDPAGITVTSYDLALTKSYTADDFGNTTDGVVQPGSSATFTITVTNQGTQTASNFTVTDYIPTGFDLNDGAWTAGAGNTATYDFVGTLAPSTSTDITITLQASAAIGAGDFVNWAEISADDGADVDSTPDGTQANDNQPADVGDPTDDVIDNTSGDEDDHDPAGITVDIYDLALTKTYTSDDFGNTTDGVLDDGSNATFTITVTNQGSVAASAFTVTDYIPTGFDLNDGAWTAGAGNTATYDFVGTLAPAASTDITITVTANGASAGAHVNWAEISADDGNDPDSTPDSTQGNDNQPADVGDPTDDVIDNTDGDEDDHDPAGVSIVNYDLALTKSYTSDTFGSTTDGLIDDGSEVTFTITVTNQGTLPASTFTVTDYIPTGFDLNDGTWTAGAGNTATYDFVGTLAPGTSTDITITMTANGAADGDYINWAEISADDGADEDSTPDAIQANDNQPADVGDPTDDVIDNTAGDEDDHDPAGVGVVSYDLALTKSYTSDDVGNTTDGIVENGGNATFTITVTNQGTLPASAFTVTDYIPTGFDLNDGAWTAGAGNTASIDFVGTLAPGGSTDITITLTANGASAGDAINWAEISSDDGDDDDSTPDTDRGNDNQPADVGDPTDDVTDNTDGDEDDHDPAGITVDVYDLALTKAYTSDNSVDGLSTDGLMQIGDNVTFTITVTNQGSLDATAVTLTDYLPTGFVLADGAWTAGAGNTATRTVGPITAGASIDATITMTAATPGAGDQVNWAEISGDDGTDIDSTPDTDRGNDNQPADVGDPTDDVTDNTDGDEDDHDPAGITVDSYDLALVKTYTSDDSGDTTDGIIENGSTATFTITVTNQGTADATTFTVTDYLPAGFTLDDAAWTAGLGNTAAIDAGPLAAGDSIDLSIRMRATTASVGATVNWAEISADDGNDADSTPDATQGNDNQPADVGDPTDDVIDNTSGDEDDHDPAGLTVTGTFDLALLKIVDTAATTSPVIANQTATFEITVINQGSLTGTGMSVIDYVDPAIWEAFDPALNPAGTTTGDQALAYTWTASGADGLVSLTGDLPAGDIVQIPVTLQLTPSADLDNILNTAEIATATPENPDGSPVVGVNDDDSTPDTTNDDPVVDDVTDNSGGDEDDHDIATLDPPTYSLGNQVWFDENDNGIIDAGETPLGQVQVQLFTDTDADGLADDRSGDGLITADDAIAASVTDAAGLYLFPGLEAGDYVVGIPPTQWDEGGSLRGLLPSTPSEPDPNTDIDGDNNGALGDHGYVWSGPATIGDGEPAGEDPDNDSATADPNENLTVDFGFWMPNFDLALRKQLSDGSNSASVRDGDQVTFRLTVFNQGTVTADQIELIDYVPTGLTLDDADWATTSDGATIALTGIVLEPGESTSVDITFRVTTSLTGRIQNLAEITTVNPVGRVAGTLTMPNGEPIPDVDSNPDANDSEDPIDDEITNRSGDEDDHDVAQVNVLATATGTTVTDLAVTGADIWRSLAAGLLLMMAGAVLVLGERKRQYGTI